MFTLTRKFKKKQTFLEENNSDDQTINSKNTSHDDWNDGLDDELRLEYSHA